MGRKASGRQDGHPSRSGAGPMDLDDNVLHNDASGSRGLFDGYEEYRTASSEDYRSVLLRGLVVPDTSVLLNLYRYNTHTRSDLLATFAKLKTLWVPDQVIGEFWRNRLAVIRDSRDINNRTIANLKVKGRELISIVGYWVNSRGADPAIKAELASVVDSTLENLEARLKRITEADTVEVPEDTNRDPVVIELDKLFEDRVGQPFTLDELKAAIIEADRRIEAREPPGYKDKGKGSTPQGDYLVWRQIVSEAGGRRADVLFITSDQKEDWWRIGSGGELLGPRGELVKELRSEGGGRLYLLTPERFLGLPSDLLQVKVSPESIVDVERVDRRVAGTQGADWTDEEMAVFDRLLEATDVRVPIEQLPEGATGSYLDVLSEMCELANDSPGQDVYLHRFQEHFPRITLKTEARRRMTTLFKLGLASESGNRILLTDLGTGFASTKDISLVQAEFLARIRGARELLGIARSNGASTLRQKTRSIPTEALSQNQATLIVRWLEQLNLIEHAKDDSSSE
jgi:hypothetical protein